LVSGNGTIDFEFQALLEGDKIFVAQVPERLLTAPDCAKTMVEPGSKTAATTPMTIRSEFTLISSRGFIRSMLTYRYHFCLRLF
jgi:hypothetical protein